MAKKGATNSGTGRGIKRNKDQAMAADLKARGVKRTHTPCPICNQTVSLNRLYAHIVVHK